MRLPSQRLKPWWPPSTLSTTIRIRRKRKRASTWLIVFQNSVYAWKISDEILHAQISEEASCFAAQTMRAKIQRSFNELPKDAHSSLRDSLLKFALNLNSGSRTVLSQLCLALADLVLLLPEWSGALDDLSSRIHDRKILLEIFTLLPEEVGSRHISLGDLRRKSIEKDFVNFSPKCLEFLNQCTEDPSLRSSILRCFRSWIDIRAISIDQLHQNPLIGITFQVLADTESSREAHEAASEAVRSILYRVEEDCPPGSVLELNLVTVIRNLEEPYHMAKKQPHYAISIFDSILLCCGHPDYELTDITFNLWYRVSEELYNKQKYIPLFRPYIERLINALYKHCQMEPDSTEILARGDFALFRSRVSSFMTETIYIVGAEEIFKHMFLNNIECGSPTWEVLEASLFLMQSVATSVVSPDNFVVKRVLESILNLPPDTHIAVKNTSVKLVGQLGNWVNGNPQYLDKILNFMLISIKNPKLSDCAANALLYVCTACRKHMAPHYEGLVHIIKSLDSFSLKNDSAVSLLKAVAVITSDLHPVQPLNAIVCGESTSSSSDPTIYLGRLAAVLRNINLKHDARSPHPCFPAIQETWPVLAKTFIKYQQNGRYMEQCCRTVRFAIRCVGTEFASLVEELVKIIITQYKVYSHSCFLYLGSILVDEFAHIQGCVMGLLGMLGDFIEPTFKLLNESDGLRNHPDTVDDFFRLNTRFLQRATVPYLQTSVINPITECAIMSVTLDHPDANASVMKFLSTLLYAGRSREAKEDFEIRKGLVANIRNLYGEKLIDKLINASIFHLCSSAFDDVSEVIYELLLSDRTAVSLWVQACLNSLPTTNSNGLQTVTKEKLVHFHDRLTNAHNIMSVLSSIKDFYRLWK
ncbi:TRPO3 [Lepeophtheirus salmonis]|uniref:TRPO3 n=1 Tax=Lepeophtheirus salmonis TaxID=72036 RepID=A0A7R8H857_LEPSM|nr:TRPO3 [Lepeophtheirus salmonis]CAF2935711.1 TRPO3 [Lepeophtheirus salmonis]